MKASKGFIESVLLKWVFVAVVAVGAGYVWWSSVQKKEVRQAPAEEVVFEDSKSKVEKNLENPSLQENKIDLQAPELPVFLEATINR